MLLARWMLFGSGALIVMATVGSAIRTVVIPRAVQARLTRAVFLLIRRVFTLRAGPGASFERRDRVMAAYAPVSLLTLVLMWLVLVLAGYAAMFSALESVSVREAFRVSGSSLLTLGFERPLALPATVLVFSEAALGLLLLALLITFLPSLYLNFSRRETLVSLLEVRAGSPPTAEEMLMRFWRIHGFARLSESWSQWEVWFAEVDETHTSFPALAFFRSPQPGHSWVIAAGAILDAASLRASVIDAERDPRAELCIRAGYVALRRIGGFFGIHFDPDPKPTDPISINREEFDVTCSRLEAAGLPLKPDRDQAWRDFNGWRVNYDRVLLGLAQLTMAPVAKWSSDRSLADFHFPRLITPRHERRN